MAKKTLFVILALIPTTSFAEDAELDEFSEFETWTNLGSFTGSQGELGSTGADRATGSTGADGATGPEGISGLIVDRCTIPITGTGSGPSGITYNWSCYPPQITSGLIPAPTSDTVVVADIIRADNQGAPVECWVSEVMVAPAGGAGAGDDYILGGTGNDRISGGADNDELYGGAGDDSITGRDGNDFLYGDGDNDILSGGAGNDTMNGGDGSDAVIGRAGDDTMTGGAGSDICLGGAGVDTADATCEISV